MAIIKFTEADKLSTIVVPTDWYKVEVTEIDGPKKSGSDKSYHFWTTFQVIEGPFTGKEFRISFNTGTKNASVLGSAQFFPHAAMMSLYAAVHKTTLDEVPAEVDTDKILRKPLDLKVEKGIHDGIPMNTVGLWLPEGTGKNPTVPF